MHTGLHQCTLNHYAVIKGLKIHVPLSQAHRCTERCKSVTFVLDILEMRNVRVTEASTSTFFKSPAGISLLFEILPFVNLDPEEERRAISLSVGILKLV